MQPATIIGTNPIAFQAMESNWRNASLVQARFVSAKKVDPGLSQRVAVPQ